MSTKDDNAGKAEGKRPVAKAKAGELFGAVSAIAAKVAPDIELAPKDASEHEIDHAVRLLGAMEGEIVAPDAALAAQKGLVTKAENARADDHGALKQALIESDLVSVKEAQREDFDPVATITSALGTAIERERDVKRSLRSQKGATTKAKNEVEALEEAAKPRSLGPVKDGFSIAELVDYFGGMSEDAKVEIAFSNGREELVGVPPVAVPASAFKQRRHRLYLDVPDLTVRGPADERGARHLLGYALLVDGEQVAWAPRLAGQLTLGEGQHYQLKDDIVLT